MTLKNRLQGRFSRAYGYANALRFIGFTSRRIASRIAIDQASCSNQIHSQS